MASLFVTGCAGFIGSHLCKKLISDRYTIIGIDNFDPFYPRYLKENNLRSIISNPNFTFIEGDITLTDWYQKVSDSKPDAVLHLAGKAGVRPSIEHPQDYIDANVTGTKNILEFMRIYKINKLVFASSSSVYGNAATFPVKEDADLSRPISPYAVSKIAAELLNYTYHTIHHLSIINLRFFTVYGPGQRPDLAINKFITALKNNKSVTLFGDGSTGRDYTYVDDTVTGIILALNYLNANSPVYEIINLGNNNPVLLKDLLQEVANAVGKKAEVIFEPEQPGDVKLTFADISKAKKLLNYSPKTSIAEGIKKYVEWIEEN